MSKKSIETIAHDLIDAEKPLCKRHVGLLGHNNPLGTRWVINSGTENLFPFKKITRKVNLWVRHEPSDHSLALRFQRIAERTFHSDDDRTVEDSIFDIFDTKIHTETSFRAGRELSRGYIDFTQTPFEESATCVTSSDIGRMMLVDIQLRESGFISDRPLTVFDAETAAVIIG